jgi:hypothetical protein
MTSAKLKSEIKTLKAALANPNQKKAIATKMKSELSQREDALMKIEAGEKAKSKAKKLTPMQQIKLLIKANPKYAGYKGANWDLVVDSKRKALKRGKRISAAGNVYYENRLNHADVQPNKKTFPRLGMGGEMHKG